jgi:uncharacterized protein YuzE
MAAVDIANYLSLVPAIRDSPQRAVHLSYDADADVLYVSLKKPSHATDSELTEDDVIVRYEGDEVVGFTVLRASQRSAR